MQGTRHVQHGRVVEIARDRRRIERGRHHQDVQVVARQPGLASERQTEVEVEAALVKLVEHDRGHVRQQRVLLETRREDALGDHEQPCVGREPALEADVPAHLAADGPALLARNARGHGTYGHAARLQHHHAATIHQRGWHARGLARARRGGEHRGAVTVQMRAHGIDVRVDGQRRPRPFTHPFTVQPFFCSTGRMRASWSPWISTVLSATAPPTPQVRFSSPHRSFRNA